MSKQTRRRRTPLPVLNVAITYMLATGETGAHVFLLKVPSEADALAKGRQLFLQAKSPSGKFGFMTKRLVQAA
jgi:hypothetical protein